MSRDEVSAETRRDTDVMRPKRDREFEQKVETWPRLERAETETRHDTFETKICLQNISIFFKWNFRQWTFW